MGKTTTFHFEFGDVPRYRKATDILSGLKITGEKDGNLRRITLHSQQDSDKFRKELAREKIEFRFFLSENNFGKHSPFNK